MSRKKPTKYLNNRDMLREIHKSKMSFCYALEERYEDFDLILDSFDEITSENIYRAKEAHAGKLSNKRYERAIERWHAESGNRNKKPKQAEFRVDPETIPEEDIVFRVMTYEHVPETPNRKKNPKTEADRHRKCNFPPFKHYAKIDGKWQEVLRSHWEGGFENGGFSTEHGKLTNELAKMMMKLVERYSMRGNWRGYTYREEMQSSALLQLSEVGLKFNEARSQNPFAYYTATINNSFTRVLNLEKKNQSIRDDMLQDGGYMPSFNRQMEDEAAQQTARDNEEQKLQELRDRNYNI